MKKSMIGAAFALILSAIGTQVVFAQNIYTFAGISSATGGYSGDGSYAVMAQFNAPTGIAVSRSGIVYICDSRNNVIRKVDASGMVTTFAGSGTAGYSGTGGAATAAAMRPTAVAVDKYGNVYVSESRNSVVRKIDLSGNISLVAGDTIAGYTGDGGAATAAEINRPTGIAVDTNGNIYISDSRNAVIREVNTSGIISTIAGNNTAGYSGDGGAATAAMINRPGSLAVSNNGTLYIADVRNNVIRMVSTSGTISTFAGSSTAGYSGDGGAATAATLNAPNGLAIDGSGNLYITDVVNNVVREVNVLTNVITTYAGNGTPGYSGDGSAAVSAQLNTPAYVATDAQSNLYITDNANDVVRRVGAAVRSITIATSHHDTVCAGVTTHFYASAYADTTPHYQWQVNGTNVGTDNAILSYTSLANGDVINCFLLDSAGGHQIAVANTLVADTIPDAGFIIGSSPICIGSTSFFRDSVAGAGGGGGFGGFTPGTWSLSDTTLASLSTFPPSRVTALHAGTDTLTFSTSNTCGTSIAKAVITLINNSNGPITGPISVCPNATVTFTDTTAGGTWNVRPGRAGTIDASGNFTAGRRRGWVYITYGSSPSCYATDSIYIDSVPRVAPIAGPTTVNTAFTISLTDLATGGKWSSSNPAIATVDSTTGVVSGISVGTVTISYSVTNAAGCTATQTQDITVVDASGINSYSNQPAFSISPNPSNGHVSINWAGLVKGTGKVNVTDLSGRTVGMFNLNIDATSGSMPLTLTGLNHGLYLVEVITSQASYKLKLVIE